MGGFAALERWEPVLRALLDERPLDDLPGEELTDADGRPLDLARSFDRDDDPDEMGRFIRKAGYLHVRGVFDDDEIAELSAETERLRAAALPDDGRSWWARTSDGEERCCRLNYANEGSPVIGEVAEDGRLDRLVGLSGEDVRKAPDRLDGHTVVIKLPDATEGLADLPWHRDCGMGGHPVLCPEFNVGIQLDDATAGSGQLHVLPGSHRSSSMPPASGGDGRTVVPLDTRAGDVTMHYGHLMHAAPAPSGTGGRRALYCTYVQEAPPSSTCPPAGRSTTCSSPRRATVASPRWGNPALATEASPAPACVAGECRGQRQSGWRPCSRAKRWAVKVSPLWSAASADGRQPGHDAGGTGGWSRRVAALEAQLPLVDLHLLGEHHPGLDVEREHAVGSELDGEDGGGTVEGALGRRVGQAPPALARRRRRIGDGDRRGDVDDPPGAPLDHRGEHRPDEDELGHARWPASLSLEGLERRVEEAGHAPRDPSRRRC